MKKQTMTALAPRVDADTPSLTPLLTLVKPAMAQVDQTILDQLSSQAPLIPTLARHLIMAGGKRLRPMLTLGALKLFPHTDAQLQSTLLLATAVEFIHTATLLHDDVVDESDLRRGKPAAHTLWGNDASVLVGDFLFSRAFQLMVRTGNLQVLDVLSKASATIAEGEVLQLSLGQDLSHPLETYLQVIRAKTATLFEAACAVSPMIAARPSEEILALKTYGDALGMAFQLTDDALDYSMSAAQMGKETGDDFFEGKVTIPVVLAYAKGSKQAKEFWARSFEDAAYRMHHLSQAQQYLEESGAFKAVYDLAASYAQKALESLQVFPASPMRSALEEAVHFTLARSC